MTISAKVIADSISEHSPRLTTLQLRYPKFIHGEFMTHRVFSRNASSSRAIPVERLIADVETDKVYPSFWGKNQPGMSAAEECTAPVAFGHVTLPRKEAWDMARLNATVWARRYAAAGYHKQIVNRLLEPFCHINVVVTATEWSNFFALRRHEDAQPEMKALADVMHEVMQQSEPQMLLQNEWHLPYIGSYSDAPEARQVSAARCARVSYLTHEGKEPSMEDDLRLFSRLASAVPLHASPMEHQATPDERTFWPETAWCKSHLHGNLHGWIQFRKTLKDESQ